MKPKYATVGALEASRIIPVNFRQRPFEISLIVDLSDDADMQYSVEFTGDDIYATAENDIVWQTHPSLVNKSVSDAGNIDFPVRAVRLNVTTYVAGSAHMSILHT